MTTNAKRAIWAGLMSLAIMVQPGCFSSYDFAPANQAGTDCADHCDTKRDVCRLKDKESGLSFLSSCTPDFDGCLRGCRRHHGGVLSYSSYSTCFSMCMRSASTDAQSDQYAKDKAACDVRCSASLQVH